MIVHLNGMPGVGKLTVARKLAGLLPARVIDNHLMVDLAESVCDRGPAYIPMLAAVTEVVYQFLPSVHADEIIVFTNALARELPEDQARLSRVRNLAKELHRPFIPILLHCEGVENERRVVDTGRAIKGKLMNPERLREIRENYEIAHYPDHANALEMDTTRLTPEETAARIAEHLKSCVAIET